MSDKVKKQFTMPTALTLLFFIMIIVIIVTIIMSYVGVSYDAKTIVDKDGTKEVIESSKRVWGGGFLDLFYAPIEGFKKNIDTIVFVLVLGIFLKITFKTQALEAGLGNLVKKLKGKEILIIPFISISMAILGSTVGFSTASIGLYPIIVPALIAAGFDSMTAIFAIMFSIAIGIMGSTVNPFTTNVTSDSINDSMNFIVGNPDFQMLPSTGIIWRTIALVILIIWSITFTMWYAKRVKKDKSKSVVAKNYDQIKKELSFQSEEILVLTKRRIATLYVFGLTFIFLVFLSIPWSKFGISAFDVVSKWFNGIDGSNNKIDQGHLSFITGFLPGIGNWKTAHLAGLFLIVTFIIAIINWSNEKEFTQDVVSGFRMMAMGAVIISMAAGIPWILEKTNLGQFIVIKMANMITYIKDYKILLMVCLYLLFMPMGFFIPSMSAMSKTIFPILGPILVGAGATNEELELAGGIDNYLLETKNVGLASGGLLAFCFATGTTGFLIPTSSVVMLSTQFCRIPYNTFLKGAMPLVLGNFVISIILLSVGTLMPFGTIF